MDIFHNDKIEFTLDGNLIYIAYNGKQYEALSGGEKQKVDLIIQFSIRDMLCNFLNFSSNILVVDEIFDNLDNIGCQEVINLISTKLSDISSIYIVSHHTDIDIPCDKELIVIKDKNGVSRLRL
jgi:DNA repair exonuclease SbcCD ATPase subunit